MPVAALRSSSEVAAKPSFRNRSSALPSAISGSYARDRRRRLGATAAAVEAGSFLLFCTISQKILDAGYIMRNGMKINLPRKISCSNAKEAHHGSLFLAARLLAGDPHRAI